MGLSKSSIANDFFDIYRSEMYQKKWDNNWSEDWKDKSGKESKNLNLFEVSPLSCS